MKPTCIAYTNTNEYNIQTCGFSIRPLKNKLYSDEKTILFVLAIFVSCSLMKADPAKKVNVTY
ncbi:MAG TPA: hypothetical protein PLZ54_06465, partial [Paludibacteraceae bacterium]|nr:hypothetical protein [Paludibacteraceae bacterium]